MKPAPGISGQAKAAGVDEDKGTDVESETPLSKRQKWRLKCRAKRLRRRERKKISASESTGTEEKGRAKQTKAESAVPFTLPTDNKKQLRNDSAPVISRNRSQTRQGTGMVGGDGGKTQSKNVKVERSDTHPGVKLSRKRKRKGVESSKEEVEFAEMVAKYRRKLQRTST